MSQPEKLRKNDQKENRQQGNHPAFKDTVEHLNPGFVITEDLFIAAIHPGSRLAKIAVAKLILQILPAAVFKTTGGTPHCCKRQLDDSRAGK